MKNNQSGFTIIEMVITLGILISLTVAAASMLKNGVDVRAGVAEQGRVTQRLSRAMERIARDIEHVYIVPNTDPERGIQERNFNTIFRIEKSNDIDRLTLTTMTHELVTANAVESDVSYVVYEVKDSTEFTGRKDLYRGEIPFQQRDKKEEPTTKLIASSIKSLRVLPWNGDSWVNDRWDTTRSDSRNKLPRMVRIEIESWANDPEIGEAVDVSEAAPTVALKTIVALQNADNFPELKQGSLNIKWY